VLHIILRIRGGGMGGGGGGPLREEELIQHPLWKPCEMMKMGAQT